MQLHCIKQIRSIRLPYWGVRFYAGQMADRKGCVFCRIADNLEPNEILFSDDDVVAFRDIRPAAKDHILVIPKIHIKDCKALASTDRQLVEKLEKVGEDVLRQLNADMSDVLKGYHWPPFNTISHLHLHLISPASQMSFLARMMFKPSTWWFVKSDYVLARL